MPDLDGVLADIESKIETVQLQAAEDQVRDLLRTLGNEELRVWAVDIQRTIDHFFPKRRRALSAVLQGRLAPTLDAPDHALAGAQAPMEDLLASLGPTLAVLSNQHIFQWNTHYRDALSTFFEQAMDSLR